MFAQNKEGYLIPCNIMVKIYPNLEEGIKIVGFLTEETINKE